MKMNLYKELRYLFDKKMQLQALGMLIIILIGSGAELLGVSAVMPIVELATNPEAVSTSWYCRMLSDLTGFKSADRILITMILLTIILYVVKNLYLSWQTYEINLFSQNIRLHFSTRLLEAYMKQPYSFFLQKNTAEIMRSVNSDTANMYNVVSHLLQLLSQAFTTVLLIVYLAVTNWKMTLFLALILAVCAFAVVTGIQNKMRKLGREKQRLEGFLLQYSKQAFEGIKEIKIMNRERYFIDEYRSTYKKSTHNDVIYNLMSYIPKYLIEAVSIGGIMGYLLLVILSGENIAAMIPTLSAFAVAAFKLLPSMNAMYNNLSNVLYNKASIDLIYHDIREVENVADEELEQSAVETLQFENEISIQNLVFAYENTSKNILNDVSLEISNGQSIAFVGESGGGKTTLVDNILGILQPQSGQILVDGVDIRENLRGWHGNIGYIPQFIFLMDDTICANVAFGVPEEEIDRDRVCRALSEARLYDFVQTLESGIDTEIGEDGMRLSGGQRQRIGIARALYFEPAVLVFDEATSALDTNTEKEVMAAIDALHGTKTMIMIAHRLTTIEKCDHVYRVEGGNVTMVR